MSKKITVAVAQVSSVPFNAEETIKKMATYTAQAAEKGAQLVLFPEAFVGTYPKGLTFGATIGNRTEQGRDEFLLYWQNAVEIPSAEMEQMARSEEHTSELQSRGHLVCRHLRVKKQLAAEEARS